MNKKMVAIGGAVVVGVGVLTLGFTAAAMFSSGAVAGIAMGLALIVFGCVIGVLTASQIRFGYTADRLLAKMVSQQDYRAYPELACLPSGRVQPAAAKEYLARCRSGVAGRPKDWREWFLLAGSYEIARDHRQAALALTRASALERTGSRPV
ncbi:hypothetical protein QMK17_23250 [Rhodococcus sp. G-MC3]|uniref:hypothetical protein n=1 Tax=Rhodococcus sp. G-MC3 TaxID=3046209 RepID=UPI0024B8EABB|nr:hypothetical protein [Rhodococcus sp. G-MC3]MDJ0396230.1 hypothetical protein [Rhodococcus sp. G-MC3]